MKYGVNCVIEACQSGIDDNYSKVRGCGIWEPVVAGGDYSSDSDTSLCNGGWNNRTDSDAALYNGGWNKRRIEDGFSYDSRRKVTIFRADVPEFGTYRVEYIVKAVDSDIENMTLFAGRRNMIDRGIRAKKGVTYKKVFHLAVFPYIPALRPDRCEDKAIFVSWTGISDDKNIKVEIRIIREEVPVIWIAGDSTLTDQNAGIPYYPYGSCAGWAQMLAMYTEKQAVCNLAHSGMTSNCFRDDGHYAIALEYMKAGDMFIMQFGHNDQKRRNLAAFGGYAHNLKRFVKEVREKGAVPIICSPISRIPLKLSEKEGYYSLLSEHTEACKMVAEEEKVAFVDLHKETFQKWVALGEAAKDYFMPGDITHTNEYGAALIVDIFVQKCEYFRRNSLSKELCLYLPDNDSKELPAEKSAPGIFDIEPPYVDIKGIPEYEDIKKAFKYALLDPCVMYLHPYDRMPRGQLLMVMLNAFRMAGVRPYKMKFADIKVDEWISGYVQALTEKDLIDPETISKDGEKLYFRPDDSLTYGEFSSFLIRNLEGNSIGLKDAFLRALELGIIPTKSREQTVKSGDFMNRAEVYAGLARYMDIAGGAQKELPGDAEIHPVH